MKTQEIGKPRSLFMNFIAIMTWVTLMWTSISPAAGNPMLQPFVNRTASQRGFLLSPVITYFDTRENFNANGQRIPLTSSGVTSSSATRTFFDLNAIYGTSEDFFLFGRLTLLVAQNRSLQNINTTGLGDQLLGAAYRVWKNDSGSSITGQVQVSIPAYSNSSNAASNTPYLGDGSTDFTLGSFGEFSLGSLSGDGPGSALQDLYLEVGGGATFRSNGFSSAIPYSLILKRDAPQGILFQAGIMGQVSLKNDQFSNSLSGQIQAFNESLRGAAGSYLVNGVNSSWIQMHGQLGYAINPLLKINGGARYPLSGNYAPLGLSIFAGAEFGFGGEEGPNPDQRDTPIETAPKAVGSGKKITKAPQGYVEYDLESTVTSVNDQFYVVKIALGKSDGVKVGHYFDLFTAGDQPQRLARGRVTHIKSGESALSIVNYFTDLPIEVGTVAKRVLSSE